MLGVGQKGTLDAAKLKSCEMSPGMRCAAGSSSLLIVVPFLTFLG